MKNIIKGALIILLTSLSGVTGFGEDKPVPKPARATYEQCLEVQPVKACNSYRDSIRIVDKMQELGEAYAQAAPESGFASDAEYYKKLTKTLNHLIDNISADFLLDIQLKTDKEPKS